MICKVCSSTISNKHQIIELLDKIIFMCHVEDHTYDLEIDHSNNIIEEYFTFGPYAILGINDTYNIIYLYGGLEDKLIFSGSKDDFEKINLPIKNPIQLIKKLKKLNNLQIFI